MIYIDEIINKLSLMDFYDEIYMGIGFVAFSILVLVLLNFKKVFSLNGFMYLLWFVALVFLAYIGNLIYCDKNTQYDVVALILPLGITLASFIASTSVMSAIRSNEKLKRIDMFIEHQSQLLYMVHIISEMKESYINIVASNNFAAHTYMFFENDQKRIHTMYENYATLLDGKYFFFLASNGYKEFKEIQTSIFHLNENSNERIGSNFSIKYNLFQTTLATNIDTLLEILLKQQKELNKK